MPARDSNPPRHDPRPAAGRGRPRDAAPELLQRFRARLSAPRRDALRQSLESGISAGALPPHIDPDIAANMLIGSFYARYVSDGSIPKSWPSKVLAQLWPEP